MKMDIQELSTRLANFKKSNGWYRASCPAHDSDGHSLGIKVTGEGNIIFHCFAGCTHAQVCAALDMNTFITTDSKPMQKQYANHFGACSWLTHNWGSFYLLDEHKEYLKKRGIDYERFNLVSTDSITMPRFDLSDEFGFTTGGIKCGALEPNRIVIPYYDGGKLVSIRSRAYLSGKKYLSMKGWPSLLFKSNLNYEDIIVTEGEFKAMVCIQRNSDACAVPGILSCHDQVIAHCKGRKATVWFDSEGFNKASRKAAIKLANKIQGTVFEITPHELFYGIEKMDIDEAITMFGSGVLLLYQSVVATI